MTTPPVVRVGPPTGLGYCSACKFWDSPDGVQGLCRVQAPDRPPEIGGRAVWPVCGANDWCGAWVTA